jgi:hypothetical protein
MKHAAVLYTCIGLMGTAAVTGFVDYTRASKSGLLENLYSEETASMGSTLIADKEIDMEDYSRGAIEGEFQEPVRQNETALKAQPKKPKKLKRTVPPPPPPPPPLSKKDVTPPPPPPPKTEVIEVTAETPVAPGVPSIEEKVEAPPAPPTPEVTEVKEVSFKSFSRAPLIMKKTTSKRKKG